MIRLWLTLATAGILVASPARAQDVTPPRIEIGGSVSGILPVVSEDGPAILASAGPRVTINVRRRIGIDLLAEVLGPVESGTMALYQAQLKLPFRASGDGQRTLSFTVGAVGLASYRHTRETRITRLDGSTVVYPGFRRFQATAPTTLSIGVSRDAVVGRSFSSSLAVQGYTGSVGRLRRPGLCRSGVRRWRLSMTTTLRRVILLAVLTAGCDTGGRPPAFVIPGPTVPSPLPTAPPYVWDTRDELAIWMNNAVARGSLALEGSGVDAFIRIDRADREWLLRGPDLTHTRGRRPHAEHPVSVAPGSRFATWRVPYRARHSALPDDHPGRRIRPQRTGRRVRHPRSSKRLDRHRVDPRAIHAADRGCVLLSAQLRRKPRRPRSRSDRARPVNA